MHAFDSRTGVIFFSQVATNAIACWNTARPLTLSNIGIIARDNNAMIYPSDINVGVDMHINVFGFSQLNAFLFVHRLMPMESCTSWQTIYHCSTMPKSTQINSIIAFGEDRLPMLSEELFVTSIKWWRFAKPVMRQIRFTLFILLLFFHVWFRLNAEVFSCLLSLLDLKWNKRETLSNISGCLCLVIFDFKYCYLHTLKNT